MPRLSFRAAILAIFVAVAVLPLALIGLWLSGSTARSGEALLAARLDRALAEHATAIEGNWLRHRSALLDFADTPPADRARAAEALGPRFHAITLRDASGAETFRLDRARESELFSIPFTVRLELFDPSSRRVTGTLDALLPLEALRGAGSEASAGAVIAAFDRSTGALLLPVPFDALLLHEPRFRWRGEDWLVRRRTLVEPPLELAAAAPLAPFVGPFRAAARRGAVALLVVAVAGTAAAALLTSRQTRSLTRLAAAADAVAAGDLQRTVDAGRANIEVARVARAFNTMTESLRRTLAQLAERESLTAVNEFAASLAHEIRNPLSAIQLDLQEVEELLPAGSDARTLQQRALADVRRLERTVAGALATARSGRIEPHAHDLLETLRAAAHAALPRFRERGARLEAPPGDAAPILVFGDPDALQRAFLNLLLNAADALAPDGRAALTCVAGATEVTVTVRDDGEGIELERLPHVFDAFHTTRPGGTGVGLAVARRIIAAHRGDIALDSAPGRGTTVVVRLPLA
jgi:signal transduction histidine kinase